MYNTDHWRQFQAFKKNIFMQVGELSLKPASIEHPCTPPKQFWCVQKKCWVEWFSCWHSGLGGLSFRRGKTARGNVAKGV